MDHQLAVGIKLSFLLNQTGINTPYFFAFIAAVMLDSQLCKEP